MLQEDRLSDLKEDIEHANHQLREEVKSLEHDQGIMQALTNDVESLLDKGCEVDVDNLDFDDGLMVISIVSPHLHDEVESLLKAENLLDESIRYSNVGELFKIRLTYRFRVIRDSTPEELGLDLD